MGARRPSCAVPFFESRVRPARAANLIKSRTMPILGTSAAFACKQRMGHGRDHTKTAPFQKRVQRHNTSWIWADSMAKMRSPRHPGGESYSPLCPCPCPCPCRAPALAPALASGGRCTLAGRAPPLPGCVGPSPCTTVAFSRRVSLQARPSTVEEGCMRGLPILCRVRAHHTHMHTQAHSDTRTRTHT